MLKFLAQEAYSDIIPQSSRKTPVAVILVVLSTNIRKLYNIRISNCHLTPSNMLLKNFKLFVFHVLGDQYILVVN